MGIQEQLPDSTWNTIRELGINRDTFLPTHRGQRAGARKQRKIKVLITPHVARMETEKSFQPVTVRSQNLIPLNAKRSPNGQKSFNFGLMNAQSCRQKCAEIVHYITDNDLDILVITESWLFSYDNHIIGKLRPDGYEFLHLSREDRQGGGVAVIHKKKVTVQLKRKAILRSMEFVDIVCTSNNKSMRLLAVYRPTPSAQNRTPTSVFF